nr:3-Oxoacyl-[acyl-carrier-protein (ACP)] synthase III [uncultured bacterium]
MLFSNVSIDAVVHVDAPIRLTSAVIMGRLRPTLDRLGIRPDLLEELAGIRERRVWGGSTQVSEAATMAGKAALRASRVARAEIGLLISTSVSRDYVEPSIASVVHGQLGLADTCQNFDVGNACLAFLNGMDIAGSMIERGDIDHALIVDAEVSDEITEHTIARLNQPETTAEQFREEFASLTLGSGATAMVLGRSDLLPDGHRYLGGVTRAATAYSHLCRGTMQRMVTDTRDLLAAGLDLASRTFDAAKETLGWRPADLDEFVLFAPASNAAFTSAMLRRPPPNCNLSLTQLAMSARARRLARAALASPNAPSRLITCSHCEPSFCQRWAIAVGSFEYVVC